MRFCQAELAWRGFVLHANKRPIRRSEGSSLAKGVILLSFLVTAFAYSSLWAGEVNDAKVMGGIVLCLNLIPAAVALVALALATFIGLSPHALMLTWPPLTLALGIPFWLWIEKRLHIRFERRVNEEVERRMAALESERPKPP
jgi:hypothetical protein